MSYSSCDIIKPDQPANASIIWLHGLGASSRDLMPIAEALQLPKTFHVKHLFPQASEIAVTINGGFLMPAWYDIYELTHKRTINQTQLLNASQAITQLIDNEVMQGIDSRRIAVAGFSQGGAVAYHTALNYPHPLAGLMALSTYLICEDQISYHSCNQQMPINIYHGRQDDVVPESLGRDAHEQLQAKGYQCQYHQYSIDHSISLQEIKDMSKSLQRWLS